MLRMVLKRGLRFSNGVNRFVLEKRLVNGKLRFEDENGDTVDLTLSEVNIRWLTHQWVVDQDTLGKGSDVIYVGTPPLLSSFAEEDQRIARAREKLLLRVEAIFRELNQSIVSSPGKLQPIIEKACKEIGSPQRPNPATVWRWWRRYQGVRCATRLVDKTRSGRPTLIRTYRGIFEEAVEEVYLNIQRLPVKDVVGRMKRKITAHNAHLPEGQSHLKMPSNATIYRWVNDLTQDLVVAARKGKKVSEKQFRAVMAKLDVGEILERVEIDHTPLDIILICKKTNMILGRPTLTLAIDRFSRMVVGFYIGFHAPSAMSVLHCLKQAVMPKEAILSKYPDITGPWPARGIPIAIAVDNGMDLHALAFEAVALELGAAIHYMGAGYPELKGAVERAIGTTNRVFIHTLPGTTFSNVGERGDYPSESLAALDIDTFTHVVLKWIIDDYHKTPHRGMMGKTPLQVWQESENRTVIELPAYPRQLDIMAGNNATRNIWHYGVEFDRLRYNNHRLQELRREGVDSVSLVSLDDRVDMVLVLDPKVNEYIEVYAIDMGYARGLTRHEHRLVMAEVRNRFKDDYTDIERIQVREEIQEIVKAAVKSKKTRDRKIAASIRGENSANLFDQDAARKAYEMAVDAAELARANDKIIDLVGEEIPIFETENSESFND